MPWKLSSSRSGLKSSAVELPFEVGQRLDVERVVVIRRQRAQRRLPAHRCASAANTASLRGGRRRRAILRVERRQRGCACSPRPSSRSSAAAMPGIAVAHRPIDHRPSAEARLAAPWPARAVIAASGEPSSVHTCAIGVRRIRRAGAQDDPVQDRLPQQCRDFDHARVAEEFGEIARTAARRARRACRD